MEIAKATPKESVTEKIKPVSEQRYELKLGISPQLEAKLKRVKDILSLRDGNQCTHEDQNGRWPQKRWLETRHRIHIAQGGETI